MGKRTQPLSGKAACGGGGQELGVWGRHWKEDAALPEFVDNVYFTVRSVFCFISLRHKFREGVYCRLPTCGVKPRFVAALLHLTVRNVLYSDADTCVNALCVYRTPPCGSLGCIVLLTIHPWSPTWVAAFCLNLHELLPNLLVLFFSHKT